MWGILQFFPIWLGWRVKISLKLTGLDRIYHGAGPQIRSSSKSPIPNMKTRKLTSASHCLQCAWLTIISLNKKRGKVPFLLFLLQDWGLSKRCISFSPRFSWKQLSNICGLAVQCKGILTRDIWPLPSSQIRDSAFLANLKCCLPHKSTLLSPSGDLGISLVWHNLSPPDPTPPSQLFGPTVEILFKVN